jgi:hypothetical protein
MMIGTHIRSMDINQKKYLDMYPANKFIPQSPEEITT